jgi:anaerobic dimethyl sulfoxide reductase subunit A
MNMMPPETDMSKEKIIPTTCASHCGGACLLQVHVNDGKITRIESDTSEDPHYQYKACVKGRAQRMRTNAPDRILYPLKRLGPRGEGKFERISWDEALDTIVREWIRVRDRYGPLSILYDHVGGDIMFVHTSAKNLNLFNKLGGCRGCWGNPSFQAAHSAVFAMYGTPYTNNMRDDLPNSKLIIMWGWDPASTMNGVKTQYFLGEAKMKGCRFICIDPRYSDSASLFADEWIPIRPSTDTAMAIAIANVMINENLYDRKFIDTYTVGFDIFRDYVIGKTDGQPKTPSWAAEITGVPAETIARVARTYAGTKPSALMPGAGVGRTAYGEQFHRTTITLAAMTGNIGIHGGDAGARGWEAQFGGYPYDNEWFHSFINRTTMRDELPYPLERASEYRKTAIHRAQIGEYLLQGECKLLFIQGMNMATQMPDMNKIARGFKVPEFVCVVEQFMTPTAKLADIILPCCTFLERNDITMGVGMPFVGLMNKAIDPIGESKSPMQILEALAQRLGFNDLIESGGDIEVQRRMAIQARVPDFDRLKREGVYRIKLDEPYIAFKKQIEDPKNNPFKTPSGKIEIYCQKWADLKRPDIPPIPMYLEGGETWRSPLAKKYPLSLITPHAKTRALSQFDNIPWLRELGIQKAWINTEDAAARDIRQNDLVRVFNDRGSVLIRAKVTGRIVRGSVSIPSGSWFKPDRKGMDRGACANTLTSDHISPVGAFTYNTSLVEVERFDERTDNPHFPVNQ